MTENIFRRYQRPLMLALAIFCLVTFSITGAALMMFNTDPSIFEVTTPVSGKTLEVGGRSNQGLARASLAILQNIVYTLKQNEFLLDRADDPMISANPQMSSRLQALLDLGEFRVWLYNFPSADDLNKRARSEDYLEFESYQMLAAWAKEEGIRVSDSLLEEKSQALLTMQRVMRGSSEEDLDPEAALEAMYQGYGLTSHGFTQAFSGVLAATELYRRLQVAFDCPPSLDEVREEWAERNPIVNVSAAIFATDYFADLAAQVFEKLFPAESQRTAELERWRNGSAADLPEEVDQATTDRRAKVREEWIQPALEAATTALENAREELRAAGEEPPVELEDKVATALRGKLWWTYLDKQIVDSRPTYIGKGDWRKGQERPEDATGVEKDPRGDFDACRWLAWGIDLDALSAEQAEFMKTWLAEHEIEFELKDAAEYYRTHRDVRFLTAEGRRVTKPGRRHPRGGGSPARQEGAAGGEQEQAAGAGAKVTEHQEEKDSGEEQEQKPEQEEEQEFGPEDQKLPEGMLAGADRPYSGVSERNFEWDEPGIKERAAREVMAPRFLEKYFEEVVKPRLDEAAKSAREAHEKVAKVLAEKDAALSKLNQRRQEMRASLVSGAGSAGSIQRVAEFERSLVDLRSKRDALRASYEELEGSLPAEAERSAEQKAELQKALASWQEVEAKLEATLGERQRYLLNGVERVEHALLFGRNNRVATALRSAGLPDVLTPTGELQADKGDPVQTCDTKLQALWDRLDEKARTGLGGAEKFAALDARGKLVLLAGEILAHRDHPLQSDLNAAYESYRNATIFAHFQNIEKQRRTLSEEALGVLDSLAEMSAKIPELKESIAREEKTGPASDKLAEMREELKSSQEQLAEKQTAWTALCERVRAASKGWREVYEGLAKVLETCHDATPIIACYGVRQAAVERAAEELESARQGARPQEEIDRLEKTLGEALALRLESYEQRRRKNRTDPLKVKSLLEAYDQWHEMFAESKAGELEAVLKELNAWFDLQQAAIEERVQAAQQESAARTALRDTRLKALPEVLRTSAADLAAKPEAKGLALVVLEPAGWWSKKTFEEHPELDSSDKIEGDAAAAGTAVIQGALLARAGAPHALEPGELSAHAAVTPRYALAPGLLERSAQAPQPELVRASYLRELARELARIRALILLEELDGTERLEEELEMVDFVVGAEVSGEAFDKAAALDFYRLTDEALRPSSAIRMRRLFNANYYWHGGDLNPRWFEQVTDLQVRAVFDKLAGQLGEIEGDTLGFEPIYDKQSDSYTVAHVARRPLDEEHDGIHPSPDQLVQVFADLRKKRLGEAVRANLTGMGLREMLRDSRLKH